ncbi:heavy metal translocating P-type ATPase [Striga asiatica]|uniref:Heavy metal translocating P-type ATPase n=1 Tax=Striga asiatica TaxID=4170 RepID=A0A5A7Q667_STRAF|nr:heavy metal translocating P-type ATPase [Striga asiatica]
MDAEGSAVERGRERDKERWGQIGFGNGNVNVHITVMYRGTGDPKIIPLAEKGAKFEEKGEILQEEEHNSKVEREIESGIKELGFDMKAKEEIKCRLTGRD